MVPFLAFDLETAFGILILSISTFFLEAKIDVISSAMEEIDDVAVKVAETGDPAYILELSPMALALFNQASGK